jgi:hypothetical protein
VVGQGALISKETILKNKIKLQKEKCSFLFGKSRTFQIHCELSILGVFDKNESGSGAFAIAGFRMLGPFF